MEHEEISMQASKATSTRSIVLYDAARGGVPNEQQSLHFHLSPDARAVQRFADGTTLLDTTADRRDAAGYVPLPGEIPALNRVAGYSLSFSVQVVAEMHDWSDKNGDGIGDRAGFSVIVLSSDGHGIELGFWEDEVWAQEEGSAEPPDGTLFTHSEGVQFDTTTALIPYTLTIQGDSYHLYGAGRPLLDGRLRDYRAFDGPVNPYRTPNFVFLGDDTSSAQAVVRLGDVALTLHDTSSGD
jgi:hypothetical protein